MPLLRLDKIIASTGRWSRKEAHILIRAGRVAVDGATARTADQKADPEAQEITVGGEPLFYRACTWILMNKPAGLLSATEDARQKTVLDLLPPDYQKQGLFPVGRLDKDTVGLLLLTNEGSLAHDLLSPRHHVEKEYFVRVSGQLTEAHIRQFASGLRIGPEGSELCQPAGLVIMSTGETSEARVVLREGKFHQIKRMFAVCGCSVTFLERVRMGPIPLDPALARGEWRLLTPDEVGKLRSAAKA